jgi:putative ABC transport system permease protein
MTGEWLPPPRFLPVVWKPLLRRRTRTLLTTLGVATAMFLFGAVRALHEGLKEATQRTAKDSVLVVYRQDRFCPFTSKLPEDYEARIRRVPGVETVVPMSIVVSNCRASLDVVTFRGVPREAFAAGEARRLRVVAGSLADWVRRSDAALLGRTLAERRRLSPGDRFDANGITVTVAAIVDSDEPQDRNVAYVDLDFLQRAPGGGKDGVVTQYNVRVSDPARIEEVATAIDAEFRSAQEPTATRPEKAFVARAAGDVLEIIGFTRWVGFGCLAAVFALVANAIALSVRDRVKEIGVLQTLGFTGVQVGGLVVLEGLVLGVAGGALGTGAAAAFLQFSSFSLSNDGLSIPFAAGPAVWGAGLLLSVGLGVLAGLVPAVLAARVPVAGSFRAV